MAQKGPSTFQKCALEFFSCFIIVFTIQNTGTKFYGAFAIAISFFIGVFIAAKVSGAHLNPAVTFMVYLNDRYKNPHNTRIEKYLPYVAAQILGCLLGGLLSDVLGGDTVKPALTEVSAFGAFLSEAMFTFFLCLGVSVIADPNSGMDPAMCGMVVCGLIFITAISIGPYTSGIVNPAIGLALVISGAIVKDTQDIAILPIYLLAPLVGSWAAHSIYVRFIQPNMPQEHVNDE